MYKHLLVPFDGSRLSARALDTAAGLARSLGSRVTVVNVQPVYPMIVGGDGLPLDFLSPSEWDTLAAKRGSSVRAQALKQAARRGIEVAFEALTVDGPWHGILDIARRKKCDLIVMASHGRGGVGALLLGSETSKVLAHTKIPVLVCK